MDRRQYLRSLGAIGGTTGFASFAGCVTGDDDESEGSSSGTGDGPDPTTPDELGYDTISEQGHTVPLVPTADAGSWFDADDDDVVFVDARHFDAYEDSRIEGAVWSPAPDGQQEDDPLDGVAIETPLVT